MADPDQIEQAVNNYMMNAMKHTRPGKSVELQLKKNTKYCEISVYNDGNGIPDSDMSRIWTSRYSRYTISVRSAASPSASTVNFPTISPPTVSTSVSRAARDSPVLMTSSTIRVRLPWICSLSSLPRQSVCTWSVVIELTWTLTTSCM